MRKLATAIVFAVVSAIAVSPCAHGQQTPSSGSVGLTASLQGNQFDILLPIWIGNTISIAPALGFSWVKDAGTDLRVGIVPRFYLSKEQLSSYIGAKVGALMASPDEGESTTDIIVGLSGGGEYFLSQRFSFGVEAQLNVVSSDGNSARFGNPGGTTISTAAAVFASIYF